MTKKQREALMKAFTQIRDAFIDPPADRQNSNPSTHLGVCSALIDMPLDYTTVEIGARLINRCRPVDAGYIYFWPVYTFDHPKKAGPFAVSSYWNRSYDLKRVELCERILERLKQEHESNR